MANRNSAVAALFLAALHLFASASPSSRVDAVTVNGLIVSGRLCCTANGNCPGLGVAGVGVRLNCTLLGQSTTVAVATTDATGAYTIIVPGLPGLILGLPVLPCAVVVRLPLQTTVCPVLSTTTGTLVGAIRVVGTLINAVLGLVQSAIVDGYVRVGV